MLQLTPHQIDQKLSFIQEYLHADNAADGSRVDANANVTHKNIATLGSELMKDVFIQINRAKVSRKIAELFGDKLAEEYVRQVEAHEIYVHDETSLKPYCVSMTLYPFLRDGLTKLGGESRAPQHLESFCGSFVNLVFAVSAQFAGAVATVEFLTYFARKDYGDNYLRDHPKAIANHLQHVVYAINQPAAARGYQSNLSADVIQRENSRYSLSDMGYFVLNDPMTEINYNFVKDVCYRAMPFLQQSLMEGRPAGLQTLGSWSDVYQGLANLPETARQSWFEFDHYYSDSMFSQAIPLVFDRPVERLLDVGANTGNWARRCLRYDSNVEITLVDLPPQLSIAKSCFSRSEQLSRIDFLGINVLEDDVTVWKEYDVIWMSQFLDCFDERGIECVLNKFSPFLATGGRLIVVELFADRQKFQAATLSLNATSLYFCCVANGNSRFYQYDEFCEILYRSGYNIDRVVDFTSGHTALVCKRRL